MSTRLSPLSGWLVVGVLVVGLTFVGSPALACPVLTAKAPAASATEASPMTSLRVRRVDPLLRRDMKLLGSVEMPFSYECGSGVDLVER